MIGIWFTVCLISNWNKLFNNHLLYLSSHWLNDASFFPARWMLIGRYTLLTLRPSPVTRMLTGRMPSERCVALGMPCCGGSSNGGLSWQVEQLKEELSQSEAQAEELRKRTAELQRELSAVRHPERQLRAHTALLSSPQREPDTRSYSWKWAVFPLHRALQPFKLRFFHWLVLNNTIRT